MEYLLIFYLFDSAGYSEQKITYSTEAACRKDEHTLMRVYDHTHKIKTIYNGNHSVGMYFIPCESINRK